MRALSRRSYSQPSLLKMRTKKRRTRPLTSARKFVTRMLSRSSSLPKSPKTSSR